MLQALWVLIVGAAFAQGAPGTEIFLASLRRDGAALSVGAPVNITNRPGYDNQPFFSTDGRTIFFTSARGGQTDIYRYDVATGATVQFISTPESEYSPTVMPDGKSLAVVRVEKDSTQRLWRFDSEGKPDKPVLDSIKPVGYLAWLAADTVFVFVLGNPATLRRANVAKGTADVLAKDIGRTIARMPGQHRVSYVQLDSAGGWIKSIDPVTGTSDNLVRLPQGNEFYAWTPQGELLSASGNRLLRWKSGQNDWEEMARFSEPGLQRITRLAVSPAGDRIALVSEEPSKP